MKIITDESSTMYSWNFAVHYEDYGSAKQAVENGEAWGVVHFGETFSKDLFSVSDPKNVLYLILSEPSPITIQIRSFLR